MGREFDGTEPSGRPCALSDVATSSLEPDENECPQGDSPAPCNALLDGPRVMTPPMREAISRTGNDVLEARIL